MNKQKPSVHFIVTVPDPNTHLFHVVLRVERPDEHQQLALPAWIPGSYLIREFAGRLQCLQARQGQSVLEIGCGMGETTAAIAQAHPEINFIGCEVFAAGVGALSKRLHDMNLKNVRIFRHDAVEVVRDMLEDNSLDGVHIFFPDPWHKARHNKRRLIQTPFVEQLLPKLKIGGYIHLATDWEEYAVQMLDVLRSFEQLQNTAADYAPTPAYRPETKFEARGKRLGHGVWDVVFVKK